VTRISKLQLLPPAHMDRAVQSISPGQRRVQELASQFLKESPIDPQKLHEASPDGDIYKKFLALLEQDPIVCGDSLLAERIVVKEVAIGYVEWLGATKRGKLDATQVPIVFDFRRMVFNGSCFGSDTKDYESKVYQGCVARSKVTVLNLANGGVVSGSNIVLDYYANSRVSSITNGNHRLLACKMLGSTTLVNINVNPKLITIYNDQPNEPLNRALLYFEELYPAEDPTGTRWETQNVINYESLLLDLADTYQSSTITDKRNELYLFTKHDLAERAKVIAKKDKPRIYGEPPVPDNNHKISLNIPLPKLLQDYEAVHIHLNPPPPQVSWLPQIWRRQSKITPLSENQQAIKSRWEEWRTTPIQAEI
jgi:hypothetical protein